MSQLEQAKALPRHRAAKAPSIAVEHCPSRRTFLAVAASAMLAALAQISEPFIGHAHAAVNAATDSPAMFLRLSMFVTGRNDLDPVTSHRYRVALSKRDQAFMQKIELLLAHIDEAKFTDMDAFLAAASAEAPLLATASSIVSAWYLGVVGEGADAELITYADALMYRPTRGVLAVPTYGPGPLAWGPKPQLV